MHVRLGHPIGVRHRVMLDRMRNGSGTYRRPLLTAARTACNIAIADRYYAPLEEELEGTLCPRCFTPDEIIAADQIRHAEEEHEREEAARWQRERDELNARAIEERKARIAEFERKYPTGQTRPIAKQDPDDDNEGGTK